MLANAIADRLQVGDVLSYSLADIAITFLSQATYSNRFICSDLLFFPALQRAYTSNKPNAFYQATVFKEANYKFTVVRLLSPFSKV